MKWRNLFFCLCFGFSFHLSAFIGATSDEGQGICENQQSISTGSQSDQVRPPAFFEGKTIRIEVSLQEQLVRVFHNDKLIKEMPCSSGKAGTPTPKGSFETNDKFESQEWLEPDGNAISFYYFTRFNGHVGFHSKIVGNSPYVEEGEVKFEKGEPSSMGCVRLLLADAKWLYEEVGFGAKVEVY